MSTVATPPTSDPSTRAAWELAHQQLTIAARTRFPMEEMRTIRNTVAPDLHPPEFQMFMAMAARYDLDPLAKEIWGVRGKSKNGREGRVLILVGRDGLLKVARRDKSYKGFDTDIHHQNDVFKVRRDKNGREIVHEYEGDTAQRGKIVGAWAQVYSLGYHDTYFYAPADEYRPSSADDWSPWTKQPSVMMQKCGLSVCLRLAYNLSGVLGEEEAAKILEEPGVPSEAESLTEVVALFPEDLRDRFYAAYSDAADIRPGHVTPATVQLYLGDADRDGMERWLADVEAENERVRQDREAEATIQDADEVLDPEEADAARSRLESLYEDNNDPTLTDQQRNEVSAEIDQLEAKLGIGDEGRRH